MAVVSKNPFDLAQEELESIHKTLDENDRVELVKKGQILQAEVHSYDEKDIFLTLNQKQTGSCPRGEFVELPAPGSSIPVMVVNIPSDGLVILSNKKALLHEARLAIQEAYETGTQLTGLVLRHFKNGLIAECSGLHMIMPEDEIDIRPRFRPPRGSEINFKVIALRGKKPPLVSRKQVIAARNDAIWNEFLAVHKEGDIIKGEVVRLVAFGIFVKLPFGLEGLLHQSDISWRKFAPFKDRFKAGQEIDLKLLQLDRENNRVSLGLRQMSQDPWEWARENLKAGSTVEGRVMSTTDYGAFVEIIEGLDGMVHSSELSWARRVLHPSQYLKTGDAVSARVISVDLENKRIALSIRQTRPDPWLEAGNRLKKGAIVEGVVKRIGKIGASVEVSPEVEGLVHFNDYSWNEKPDRKMLKPDDKIKVKVLEIRLDERKLTLGLKQLTPGPHEIFRNTYRTGKVLDCTIRVINDKGIEVQLPENLTGWIPRKFIPLPDDKKLEENFSVGQELKASLSGVNVQDRRITLSIKDFEKQKDRELIRQYIKKDESPSTASLGSLLKKKLEG